MIFDSIKKVLKAGSRKRSHIVRDPSLVKREANIGGKIFGKLPPGRQRLFYLLKPGTWVWEDIWGEANGQKRRVVRYEVRTGTIIKYVNDNAPKPISLAEAERLALAAHTYRQLVSKHIYGITS